jgi:soluble lytic murein transglycosylase
MLLSLWLPRAQAQDFDVMTPALQEQRQWYLDARSALARRDRASFEALRTQLSGYSLRPYLDYAELAARLNALPTAEVHDFLTKNSGTVLAQRLRQQWLQTLADAKQWPQLIADYDAASATTELSCQMLEARLRAGDTTALDEVSPFWNVPRSQPGRCDPLFNAWRAAGRLTPALTWERFSASLSAGQTSLATYLATLLPLRERQLATLWLETAKRPEALRERANYAANAPELTPILLHTLRRLAQSDASLAWELAEHYAAQQHFAAADALELRRYIAQRLLLQDQISRAETLLHADPALPSDSLVEWLLRDALKQQQWDRLDTWLPLLSTSAQGSERWRYWRARSLQQQGAQATGAAEALLAALAETRSFYGFLAADRLKRGYAMVDRPLQISDAEFTALLTKPAFTRAVELFLVGDETNAQREWQQALSAMNPQEVLAAGKLAERISWYRNGITALSQVSYWDDLGVRFPLAYQDLIGAQARQTQLDSTFIYAIARQESAFISNARSSAGALGLMQLMPATARDVAKTLSLRLGSNQDILEPSTNLRLGSRYLAQMLQDFGGNRILATAAYNAGPGRVRQWRAQSASAQPVDLWIETIPFNETRNYVQNVLTYAVIYGYRLAAPLPLLTTAEAETPL